MVFDLRIADGIEERVGALRACDGFDFIMSAGVFFPIRKKNERLAMPSARGQLLRNAGEDGIVNCAAAVPGIVGLEFWKVARAFVESYKAIDDRGRRRREIADQPQVIAKAHSECLVLWAQDAVEKYLNVPQ